MKIEPFLESLKTPDIEKVEILIKERLTEGFGAGQILNDGLIKAMTIIGEEFRQATIWVPEVLLAARNMQRGITLLQPALILGDVTHRGKFLIGTVKGDIHDIGKNLVSMMMVGAGFEVVDLGVNVPREKFLQAISEHQPDVVGLSALLTTTMMEMKAVIELVKSNPSEKYPKLIIGGAPVSKEFADEIGADGYGEDAMVAVDLANSLCDSREGEIS
jgi:methanogenic corrinoid protein MtbC1